MPIAEKGDRIGAEWGGIRPAGIFDKGYIMATNKEVEIAMKIHSWLEGLKNADGWAVHSQSFLPANVCCDHQGKMSMIRGIARIIFEEYKPLI